MVELLLLRHAKSRRDVPGLADHDRDLAPRGEADAPRVGRLIAELGLVPDLVLCSTARRAQRTWELAAAALGSPPPATVLLRELYLAPAARLLALLRSRPGSARRVAVVAHDPGLHALAVQLAGEGDADLRARLAAKFPTGGLAHLVGAGGWDELGRGPARLAAFRVPRELG